MTSNSAYNVRFWISMLMVQVVSDPYQRCGIGRWTSRIQSPTIPRIESRGTSRQIGLRDSGIELSEDIRKIIMCLGMCTASLCKKMK